MIWESKYWKTDLRRRAAWLTRRQTQQARFSLKQFAEIEQHVMIGFYCIRKLIEADCLSKRLSQKTLRVDSFPANGNVVDSTNWDMIGLHYTLQQKTTSRVSVLWLCHQFVHSYVFVPSFRGAYGPMDGIYFNSDRGKDKMLYRITMRTVVSLFRMA